MHQQGKEGKLGTVCAVAYSVAVVAGVPLKPWAYACARCTCARRAQPQPRLCACPGSILVSEAVAACIIADYLSVCYQLPDCDC